MEPQFLIDVVRMCDFYMLCRLIVSKALLISSATVIVRVGGAIWLNPFATMLFILCVVPSL